MIDKIQNSFLLFCRNMEPQHTFAKHHKFICKKAQELSNTPDGRLLLSIAPGHSKSSLLSVLYPAWLLGQNPKLRILIVTYGQSLSDSFGKRVRQYINSEVYKKIFPDTLIKGDGEGGSFDTTNGGYLNAVGRGGSLTGRRYDVIICDDVLKNQQEAQSDTIINNLHSWFSTTCYSRLVPPGKFIGIATRWSLRDLTGHIVDNYGWPYINIPAICEEENDVLGRTIGEALWPEFYSEVKLAEIKKASPKTFNALYQGNCVAAEATPIKYSSILSAIVNSYNSQEGRIVISWDTASTEGSGDYTVGSVWNIKKDNAVLLSIIRNQVDFNNLLLLFENSDKVWKPDLHIIENASSGRQLIQAMQSSYNILSSSTIKTELKESLSESLDALLRRGQINILQGALISSDIEELTQFPFGRTDDLPLSILHFYKNYLDNDLLKWKRKENSSTVDQLKKYSEAIKYISKKKNDKSEDDFNC